MTVAVVAPVGLDLPSPTLDYTRIFGVIMYKHNHNTISKRLRFSQSGAGFTLLELIITTAIIGILTAIMFTNFSKEKQRNALKASMNTLQVDLKAMQTNAQAGVLVDGSPVNGFGIALTNGGASYVIYADSNSTTPNFYQSSDLAEKKMQDRTLGQDVIIKKFTVTNQTALDIEFTAPNGKALFQDTIDATIDPSALSTETIVLQQTKLNLCYAITVAANVGTVSLRQLTTCPAT